MTFTRSILLAISGLSLGVLLIGQGTGMTQTKQGTLKRVSAPYSDPGSGKQMFQDYCAVCHGTDGKGSGPAVQLLKAPPPDLTTMVKRHTTKSAGQHVRSILRFGGSNADGPLTMPAWGQVFRQNHLNDKLADLRINNLSDYVESIQQ
jgi:mono/diheme cytochrome c family protein